MSQWVAWLSSHFRATVVFLWFINHESRWRFTSNVDIFITKTSTFSYTRNVDISLKTQNITFHQRSLAGPEPDNLGLSTKSRMTFSKKKKLTIWISWFKSESPLHFVVESTYLTCSAKILTTILSWTPSIGQIWPIIFLPWTRPSGPESGLQTKVWSPNHHPPRFNDFLLT